MKKKILLLVTGLSSLSPLVACSNQSNHLSQTNSASSVEQSQSDGSESEDSSSSEEKKVDTSAYDDIISKYQTAVADNQTDASINPLVGPMLVLKRIRRPLSMLIMIWMVMG